MGWNARYVMVMHNWNVMPVDSFEISTRRIFSTPLFHGGLCLWNTGTYLLWLLLLQNQQLLWEICTVNYLEWQVCLDSFIWIRWFGKLNSSVLNFSEHGTSIRVYREWKVGRAEGRRWEGSLWVDWLIVLQEVFAGIRKFPCLVTLEFYF